MSEPAAPVSAFSDFGRVARLSSQAALSRADRIQEERHGDPDAYRQRQEA